MDDLVNLLKAQILHGDLRRGDNLNIWLELLNESQIRSLNKICRNANQSHRKNLVTVQRLAVILHLVKTGEKPDLENVTNLEKELILQVQHMPIKQGGRQPAKLNTMVEASSLSSYIPKFALYL